MVFQSSSSMIGTLSLLMTLSLVSTLTSAAFTRQLHFINECKEPIWVGTTPDHPQDPVLADGGFKLGEVDGNNSNKTITLNHSWKGRFWPRTNCTFETGTGLCPESTDCCASGGCWDKDGKFGLKCSKSGNVANLMEVTFGSAGIDVYDNSLVDGWNIPMTMTPVDGTYNTSGNSSNHWCRTVGQRFLPTCPSKYMTTFGGCQSPCHYAENSGSSDAEQAKVCCVALNKMKHPNCTCPEKCMKGGFGCSPIGSLTNGCNFPPDMVCDPNSTDPTRAWDETQKSYIDAVHHGSPRSYAWQFDDRKGIFKCKAKTTGDTLQYTITFCPRGGRLPSLNPTPPPPAVYRCQDGQCREVRPGTTFASSKVSIWWCILERAREREREREKERRNG